ncbi:MAG: anti-sigma regulatory factor [Deltaproteobacteria bacterium]|nr:anti-sigma regulatory factor [Deltaproteobacteria bacterium]
MSACKIKPFQASFSVCGGNFDDAGLVSGRIKTILKEMGFTNDVLRRTAIVTYEAEVNMVSYAERGKIRLLVLPDHVVIEATDEGPGIADIRVAIQQGWSTANEKIREMGFGAGMGLNNIRTFSDIFHISSDPGVGTRLKMIIATQEGPDRRTGGAPP